MKLTQNVPVYLKKYGITCGKGYMFESRSGSKYVLEQNVYI